MLTKGADEGGPESPRILYFLPLVGRGWKPGIEKNKCTENRPLEGGAVMGGGPSPISEITLV